MTAESTSGYETGEHSSLGMALRRCRRRRTQGRPNRAKSLVDCCVTLALLSVLLVPGTAFSHWFDLIGSVIVAVYLILCGVKTIRERRKG